MLRVAIVGFGNVGRAVYEALSVCKDLSPECIIEKEPVAADIPVYKDISALTRESVDMAIVSLPSRIVPDFVLPLLRGGISTVDGYDVHSDIFDIRKKFDKAARDNNCVSIVSAGWDPGSDSILRAVFSAMLPRGLTYTDFGPGMSMGHTVMAKAVPGVKNALAVTVPLGAGTHRRMVYIELENGADMETVSGAIRKDDYFIHDETHIIAVESVDKLKDVGHGVKITRKGVSGVTGNQRIEFNMSINNPALTAQVLVSSARAASRQRPGCYTMIEIPPIDLLEGDRESLIRGLV